MYGLILAARPRLTSLSKKGGQYGKENRFERLKPLFCRLLMWLSVRRMSSNGIQLHLLGTVAND